MQVVTAGIPEVDSCPVLTRIKSFIVDQGVPVILEAVIRDRKGNPIDLTEYLGFEDSDSDSESDASPLGSVAVRIQEFTGIGLGSCNSPLWALEGQAQDSPTGKVRVALNLDVVQQSGIYQIGWGIKDADGQVVIQNSSLLSVERSMFADLETLRKNQGPPTINEIRMYMMDSSGNENFLLDDVEFSDEQICLAMTKPIQMWNETPPPIETFTTRTFPFRGAWVDGILSELYAMAAAHYRRNYLATSGGGTQIQDKNKEREYLAESQRLAQKYETWLHNKKVSINFGKFSGHTRSQYVSRNGW